jgi:hypothetical protein
MMKVELTHIVEDEEGGNRYVFEMNQEGVDHMVTLGLELALACAIYGVDPRAVLDGISSMPGAALDPGDEIDGPHSPEEIGEMFNVEKNHDE